MEKVMEMVNVEMDMNVIREAAKTHGIKKVHGVKKELLVAQVNEAIKKAANEVEVTNEMEGKEMEVKIEEVKTEEVVSEVEVTTEEVVNQEENTQTEDQNEVTNETTQEAPKPGKWFEAEGAFPYKEGDVILITSNKHKGLIGRIAMVTKPSAKKDATKAQLLHPKTGELQNTHVTLDFSGIEIYLPVSEQRKEEEVAAV